jgi:hypothetical protein
VRLRLEPLGTISLCFPGGFSYLPAKSVSVFKWTLCPFDFLSPPCLIPAIRSSSAKSDSVFPATLCRSPILLLRLRLSLKSDLPRQRFEVREQGREVSCIEQAETERALAFLLGRIEFLDFHYASPNLLQPFLRNRF